MLEPSGRVIMVSGANRGIGLATVHHLAALGYSLSLGARDPGSLPEGPWTGHEWQATDAAPGEVLDDAAGHRQLRRRNAVHAEAAEVPEEAAERVDGAPVLEVPDERDLEAVDEGDETAIEYTSGSESDVSDVSPPPTRRRPYTRVCGINVGYKGCLRDALELLLSIALLLWLVSSYIPSAWLTDLTTLVGTASQDPSLRPPGERQTHHKTTSPAWHPTRSNGTFTSLHFVR